MYVNERKSRGRPARSSKGGAATTGSSGRDVGSRRELRACERKLQRFTNLLSNLAGRIEDADDLTSRQRAAARSQYRVVVEGLRLEYRRGSTDQGFASLSAAERKYCYSAIAAAYEQLWSPRSVAMDRHLLTKIDDARIDLGLALVEIEDALEL